MQHLAFKIITTTAQDIGRAGAKIAREVHTVCVGEPGCKERLHQTPKLNIFIFKSLLLFHYLF